MRFLIFCEEAGDKGLILKQGTSRYYVISAVIVPDNTTQHLRDKINSGRREILRHRKPLEWKSLSSKTKNDDERISRFMDFLLPKNYTGPRDFVISQVIADKSLITGPGLNDSKRFMNYLYGIIFKRISPMLNKLNASAEVFIDRNTDPNVHQSLTEYLNLIPMIAKNNNFPLRRGYSRPTFMEPKDDPILQLADFVSGLTLRIFEDYKDKFLSTAACQNCMRAHCAVTCGKIAIKYSESWQRVINWNYGKILRNGTVAWDWRGLLWYPCGKNPVHMIVTK
ncbi:DUF3800 domain-containing protein [Alicyclobacillus sendaiensis]|uniref:DUF3800 domain-containing protein n=1 Tax=Alicyclobacillus sendaiensis TaxID=192387 RepID=UPI0026F45057|nr:DUF3800 domain-containing protein [Alicyclobacillus sendaiensis]